MLTPANEVQIGEQEKHAAMQKTLESVFNSGALGKLQQAADYGDTLQEEALGNQLASAILREITPSPLDEKSASVTRAAQSQILLAEAAGKKAARLRQQQLEELVSQYDKYEKKRAQFREALPQIIDEDRDKLFVPGTRGRSVPGLPLDNLDEESKNNGNPAEEKGLLDSIIGAFGS